MKEMFAKAQTSNELLREVNIVLYKRCPYSYQYVMGNLRGTYCNIPVEVNKIYCNGHSCRRNCPKITEHDGNTYLDEHSNFVFIQEGTCIIILGVASSDGLIPLNEEQIQFAEERGWLVDDTLDIKEPGYE